MDWKQGDRVVIRPSDNWSQPRRGWAERGRLGTVQRVTKYASGSTLVSVLFDRTRNKLTGIERFLPDDLLPAPANAPRH